MKRRADDFEDDSIYKKMRLSANTSATVSDSTVDAINNHIYFSASVTSATINKLVKLIQTKNNEYKKIIKDATSEIKPNDNYTVQITPNPIYLHISSFGGSILAAMSAIDCIIKSEIPIYTIVDGYAASAGTIMSIVGKKRYITKNSYMLIHQLSSGVFGQMRQIEDNFTNCKLFMDRIKALYLKHTKLEQEQLEEQLKHDNWWDAETCIKHGLADEYYE